MRVLHLVDQKNGQGCPTLFELLNMPQARLADIQQRSLLLGGETIDQLARDAGLEDYQRMGVPYGSGPWAATSIRRRCLALGPVDLLHCWSVGALTVGAMTLPRTQKILTLTSQPSAKAIKWLRMISKREHRETPTIFLTISSTIRRELLAGGIAPERVHVLRPGIDRSKISEHSRKSKRQAWGVDENTRVIGLAADPLLAMDIINPVWITALAGHSDEASGRTYAMVLHPENKQLPRAEKILSQACPNGKLILDEDADKPWAIYPACDMIFGLGQGCGLSILWAMASNRIIAGEATYGISEMLEDRHSAILAAPGARTEMAHKIIDLFDDEQQAYALRDTAHHEAYSYFSRSRYCQQLKDVYQQLHDGQAVNVPEIEATGGLKFAGMV